MTGCTVNSFTEQITHAELDFFQYTDDVALSHRVFLITLRGARIPLTKFMDQELLDAKRAIVAAINQKLGYSRTAEWLVTCLIPGQEVRVPLPQNTTADRRSGPDAGSERQAHVPEEAKAKQHVRVISMD